MAAEGFSHRVLKDGRVRVAFRGRHVVTVAGGAARKLASELRDADADGAQLLLAKATGNFKRGNERRPQPRR